MALAVLGGDQPIEGLAEQLSRVVPENSLQFSVDLGDPSAGTDHQHPVGRDLHGVAKTGFGLLQVRDIDERDDDAAFIRVSFVGQDSHEERFAVGILDLLLVLSAIGKHPFQLLGEFIAADGVDEAVDAATDVGFDQVEDFCHFRRESADAELIVEEDRVDVSAREQVVHVVGEFGQLLDLVLVLRVDRVQFFVHRMELFVGRLQLLVGR